MSYNLLNRVSNKLKRSRIELILGLGFDKRLLASQKGDVKVVMYHGIDLLGSLRYNHRFTSLACFEKQIRYFQQNCNVLHLEDVFNEKKCDKKKLNIAITFDDGYQNNLTYGLPILEKYRVPATFFITSIRSTGDNILWADYIDLASYYHNNPIAINGKPFIKKNKKYHMEGEGIPLKTYLKSKDFSVKQEAMDVFSKVVPDFKQDESLRDYWQLLNEDEIRHLANSELVTIGSHSHLHNNLDQIELEDAAYEMSFSKEYLEGIINKEVKTIAFPDGGYNEGVKIEALKLGYEYLLATNYRCAGDTKDSSIKNRIGVYSYQSCNHQLHSVLSFDKRA